MIDRTNGSGKASVFIHPRGLVRRSMTRDVKSHFHHVVPRRARSAIPLRPIQLDPINYAMCVCCRDFSNTRVPLPVSCMFNLIEWFNLSFGRGPSDVIATKEEMDKARLPHIMRGTVHMCICV